MGFTGLSFDLHSIGAESNADIVGLCQYNRPQAVAHCVIRNGSAQTKSVTLGEYYPMNKLCQKSLKKGRKSLGYSYRKSVVLDYSVEPRDLDALSEYSLKGVVLWGIYEPQKSSQNPQKISKVYVGDKGQRFTCFVNKGEVSELTYSKLGDVTWNEKGELHHYGFFDD